jgi:hypothetical protein
MSLSKVRISFQTVILNKNLLKASSNYFNFNLIRPNNYYSDSDSNSDSGGNKNITHKSHYSSKKNATS